MFTISNSTLIISGILLLLVFIFLSIVVAKSVRKQTKAQKEVEELKKNLIMAENQLRELDTLKLEFVSIASHQLRSPLTAIKGYASMILEGSFGELPIGASEAVGRILESSRYMVSSVEDFLNISRIEQGRMTYEMITFDISELIQTVISEQKSVAEKKKIVLTFKGPTEGVCNVKADPGKMKQVINNLIDNAIKYTKEDSVLISLTNDVVKKKALITIADNGIGMSAETLKTLFTKFARAKNASNVNVMGTGLGLYVAKQLVLAHKGRVWGESEGEGKGSTFYIELPLN